MKNKIFVVYNKVSCRYGEVFASANFATASREVLSRLSMSPLVKREDLCLREIATIDVEVGVVDLVYSDAKELSDDMSSLERSLSSAD